MLTHIEQPDSPTETADDRRHAVIIGAGFGGLAAAVRLGARGYKVTVVDRLAKPGGRANVFEQDGFKFDAGPTIITAPFLFEELWTLCGKKMSDHVTLKELSPCYTIRFHDGETFNCYADEESMLAEIARFEPSDVAGYKKFMLESEKCFKTGFERMVDKPFPTLMSMAQYLPALLMRRADRSVYGLTAKHIKNERLRQALSFHPLFVGGNPMKTTAIFSLISYLEREWGVHYAMGGTGALAQGLSDLITDQGNMIRLETDVAEILTEGRKAVGVRLMNGEIIKSDIVVSNADPGWTYKKLIPNIKRKRWTDKRIDRAKHSMSLFVWYFGTDKHYDNVEHHTIMMGPRYQELLTDIFDRKILADDFSLYLYRPSASDPSVAPPGCDAYYVLAPVPNLEGDIDWEAMAEPYRKKIEAHLQETLMPGLKDHVISSKVMTPLEFESDLLSVKGAGFGMQPIISQIGWFRPNNVSEEVENLYLVGAGTHPGAGVPGVVASARILDKVLGNVLADL